MAAAAQALLPQHVRKWTFVMLSADLAGNSDCSREPEVSNESGAMRVGKVIFLVGLSRQ